MTNAGSRPGHVEAGQESGSWSLRLAPAEAGAVGSLRVVPVQDTVMRFSLLGPSCFVHRPLGSFLPVRTLTVLFVCAVPSATWLLFSGVHARCVALRVRCPGPLGSCSPVCLLGALCCVRSVLRHVAGVHRCARSVDCVACAVCWANWLLFTGVLARFVALCVQCPGPLGSCSPVCSLGVLCCVCGVLGHLALVQGCVCAGCCVACAVYWANWLLYTGVPAQCVVLSVRCRWPLGTCSQVCTLCVLCCVYGVLGHLALVQRCAPLPCSVRCAVSSAT